MRKIFLLGLIYVQLVSQTVDINALRTNTSISGMDRDRPNINNETQNKISIPLDEPIQKENYLVGPGDRFEINIISSDNVFTYSLVISPTGEILIPSIGIINVSGKTLIMTINEITERIHQWNQNAIVNITLSQIREFNVKIIGHLQNPGLYKTNPVSRISDIYNSLHEKNPIKEKQNNKIKIYPELTKRNIKIIREKDTLNVDLVKFGSIGDNKYNPFIQQGDIIQLHFKKHIYSIFGGVTIPGEYEYVNGETLHDIILLAGGLRPDADPNKIEITRFTSTTEKYSFETNINESKSIIIEPEDHIMIRYEQDYKRQDVIYITGEVRYPGVYSIDNNSTLNSILIKAGGFTNKADSSKLQINNFSISDIPDREEQRILLIPEENRGRSERAYIKARALTNKGAIESNSMKQTKLLMDFLLVNNDRVFVPENYNYIEVLGGVVKPGRYPYVINNNYKDYLKLAGGHSETSTKNIYIIKAGTGQRIPAKKNIIIENGDTIFIADKMEYNLWTVLRDILTGLGQVAALIVVIQNAIGQ